jgi:beta-glucosidase
VHLAPGEERAVSVAIPIEQLRFLDANMRWVLEPGVLRVMVGASSEDIRLRGELTLTSAAP